MGSGNVMGSKMTVKLLCSLNRRSLNKEIHENVSNFIFRQFSKFFFSIFILYLQSYTWLRPVAPTVTSLVPRAFPTACNGYLDVSINATDTTRHNRLQLFH